MSYEITGKLYEKMDTQEVSSSFRKREFVLEVKSQGGMTEFTDFVKFQLIQDKCDLIDQYSVGDNLKVNFNIKGNRWEKEGKVMYFTNLAAWRIESGGETDSDRYEASTDFDFQDDDVPF